MKTKLTLSLAFLTLALAGCSVNFNNGSNTTDTSATDGGIYKSINQGTLWQQKNLIPTVSGRPNSFNAFNSYVLMMDPSDRKALYLGTVGEGLLYSYDSGESWQRVAALGRVTIRSIAVDPVFKCTLYASVGNKLDKSIDCGRTFSQVYFDNDPSVTINAVAINPTDSSVVYIGTSRGEVIKSANRGDSWQTVTRFESKIQRIMISPYDANIIFAATQTNSLHVSQDGGATFVSLDKNLKDFPDSVNFKDLAFSGVNPGLIFFASNYGLLKSPDYGKTWTKITLITPADKATINSLAVSPKNDQEIYYVTNTTFYRSVDGGVNWTTKKLPTTRVGWELMIDPVETNVIYLAVRSLQ